MKKALIIILILLFLFALVRIGTSTYENLTRTSSTYIRTEGELIGRRKNS